MIGCSHTLDLQKVPRQFRQCQLVSRGGNNFGYGKVYKIDYKGGADILSGKAAQVEAPAQPKIAPPQTVRYATNELAPGFWVMQGTYADQQMIKPEIQYRLKAGSTHNSYLLKSDNSCVLVDPSSAAFKDFFVAELTSLQPLTDITHVVLTHLAAQSLPTIQALLERCKVVGHRVTLVLANPALQQLKIKFERDDATATLLDTVDILVAKTGTTIPFGRDKLRVMPCTTPRWPDLFALYIPGIQTMLTSCLFSAHVAPIQKPKVPELLVKKVLSDTDDDEVDFPELRNPIELTDRIGGWGSYYRHWKYFFECMLAPVSRQAKQSIDKLSLSAPGGVTDFWGKLWRTLDGKNVLDECQVKCLAPMYGPIITTSVSQILYDYNLWLQEAVDQASETSIAVLYASAYGNTASLAQAVSRGITKAGIGIESVNLETVELKEVEDILKKSSGFIIGTPTLGGHMPTQVQAALGTIMKDQYLRKLPCGVFGSFGWSGEAVDEVASKLKDAGFKFAFEPIRVKFTPTQAELQICEESGTDLAQLVLKEKIKQDRKAGLAPQATELVSGKEKALGRIVGCMCVITTKDEDANGAMLASWVSQASFSPPGLTFALKKDRAMDSLLTIGSVFLVNVLPEGKDRPIAKALLKKFAPGEDRFSELKTSIDDVSGARVLEDACAMMRCTLTNKMDAGDHWIVYGTVDHGRVMSDANSAVHHRKVGTYY